MNGLNESCLPGVHATEKAATQTEPTPAEVWDSKSAQRALDELFALTHQYRSSGAYLDMLGFVAKFKFYSPFNAMLVHLQMPGATFVATPHRWLRDYGRIIKPGARPLVILQPMGPVMFVFDVNDTEPTEHARPLPFEVETPFEGKGGSIKDEFEKVVNNAKRDGIRVVEWHGGSQAAGSITAVPVCVQTMQKFPTGRDRDGQPVFANIPVLYDIVVNRNLSPEARYATVVHELAHLYCGHLGTPNADWWPDRRGLNYDVREFEAESVTYLVCSRCDIANPSEEYLSGCLDENKQVPSISLDCVMRAAGLIETMSRQTMKVRKPAKDEAGR